MKTKQVTTPDVNVSAVSGWCLKYVDDAGGAPNTNPPRQQIAQAAFEVESSNGNVRTGDLPVGVWVPIFFALNTGPYAGLGHVAWAKNFGDRMEIHDSEVHSGRRAPYTSIDQVLQWFSKHGISYSGYSLWVDGVQAAEEYADAPTDGSPDHGPVEKVGTATVTVDELNVRNEPSTDSAVVAVYTNGQTFNYDSYLIQDGYVWLSYESYSGVRRYVAEGPNDGDPTNVYVSGGIS